MGQQIAKHVLHDAEKIAKFIDEENWIEATNLLVQVDYKAPIEVCDLLKHVYSRLALLLRKYTVKVIRQLPDMGNISMYNPEIPRLYVIFFASYNEPQHQEAERFISVGINRFVELHQQYGETQICWWTNDYNKILENVEEFGFSVIPLYAKIYGLVLNCSYVDNTEDVLLVVEQAASDLGQDHSLIEKIRVWARESSLIKIEPESSDKPST